MKDYIKSGSIAARVKSLSRKWLGEGVSVAEFADKVEGKIKDLGAKPAFPVNISFNECAAHDTARPDDKRVFKKGDVVKVDLGAHVNGCIADTAYTKEIGSNDHTKLITASEEALESAIKVVKLGVELRVIGSAIHSVISKHGFEPIYNLGGHPLNKYTQHGEFMIPNYDNNSEYKLKKGVIAIEPFVTNGSGWVKNSNECFIYNLKKSKPTRSIMGRKILALVKKEYQTLPFAERWIAKEIKGYKLGLMQLVREGILHAYPVLKEKTGGIVAQSEDSMIVDEKIRITTR